MKITTKRIGRKAPVSKPLKAPALVSIGKLGKSPKGPSKRSTGKIGKKVKDMPTLGMGNPSY